MYVKISNISERCFQLTLSLSFVSMTSVLNTYFNAVHSQDTKHHTFRLVKLPVKSKDFKFKCKPIFLWLMHTMHQE